MIQEVSKRLYGPGVGFFQLHFPRNTNILLHPSPLIILLNCFQSLLLFLFIYLFIFIQTPGREFLLRVSYLEIYNEVSFYIS